jgi:secondary thiamine-phosphate synthase enzyme
MKSFTEYLLFNTRKRQEILNITPQVEAALRKSGIQEGLMLVNPMHITASVYVNDAEPGLYQDILAKVEELAPYGKPYQHHHTGEDNGDAHLKRQLLGQQVVLAVTQGRLDFGPWEQVHYAEFDGKRPKRVIVKIIGE